MRILIILYFICVLSVFVFLAIHTEFRLREFRQELKDGLAGGENIMTKK